MDFWWLHHADNVAFSTVQVQQFEDKRIAAKDSWYIRELKGKLSEIYPTVRIDPKDRTQSRPVKCQFQPSTVLIRLDSRNVRFSSQSRPWRRKRKKSTNSHLQAHKARLKLVVTSWSCYSRVPRKFLRLTPHTCACVAWSHDAIG